MLLHTVLVDAGTVYSVVKDAAPGADCPSTFSAVAIYIPTSKNDCV